MEEKQFAALNKRALVTYIVVALGFTWICWIPTLWWAFQNGYAFPTVNTLLAGFSFANQQHVMMALLFSLAVYGPLIGGFVATYMEQGKPGIQTLLGRMGRWRVSGKWYGTAVILILILTVVPVVVGMLLGMTSFKPGPPTFTLTTILLLFILQILTSGLGEEPGWRGYLLPTLQASYPQRKAIWLMGLIWAIWHFPFTIHFTLAAADLEIGTAVVALVIPSLLGQIISLIGIAYLYTWMFNRTGSIFLLIIFHALSNLVPALLTEATVFNPVLSLFTAVMPWVIVVILERRMGKEQFPGPADAFAS